jgi:DNA-binding response OmpR family regulator
MDQNDRDFVAAALAAWGFPVITAMTAAEAIAALRDRPLQAAFVDRATLAADLAGFRALRTVQPGTPLVLMSMGTDEGDVEQFGREQARAVLAPPFQLRAIRSAVQAVIKECV